MPSTDNTIRSNIQKITDHDIIEIDFGIRKISDQNFSKIIALPKGAIANCGNPVTVNVKLVQDGNRKYIKIVPLTYKDLEEI